VSAPAKIAVHLGEAGYHPRSNTHGKILCELVLTDLLAICPRIAADAAAGRLVYDIQRKIMVAGSEWNIDLVLGPPPRDAVKQVSAEGIPIPPTAARSWRQRGWAGCATGSAAPASPRASPATIRIAIEAKTGMTEHAKARRNRQRDLDSFHQFVHRYDSDTVAVGLTVVNVAERFKSPLRSEVSIHRNVRTLVQETMALLRSLPQRSARGESPGLEANGAIVVSHDNIDLKATALVTVAPAPQIGDPLHYDSFLRRICDSYTQRWSAAGNPSA